MLKTILGIFLIAHGLVHAVLAIAPNPADPDARPGAFFTTPDRSWLLSRIGTNDPTTKWIGIALVVLSTLGFLLAGLGFLGIAGLGAVWQPVALTAAGVSLVLLVLFWHPWLPVGVLIDILTLAAILWQR